MYKNPSGEIFLWNLLFIVSRALSFEYNIYSYLGSVNYTIYSYLGSANYTMYINI